MPVQLVANTESSDRFSFLWLRVGFLRCILLVLRVREGGLVVGGPPCSSFVFINTGTSRRSRKKVLGRETLQYVADANAKLAQIRKSHAS